MVDSDEGVWNTGRDEKPNLGYKIRHKEGYFPVMPTDQFQDLRTEMMLTMIDMGINVEVQHLKVGTAGQAEIDLKFAPLVEHADNMLMYKYVIKNVAFQNGYTATFMPKPLFQDNGSGMHTHVSFWKDGSTLMFDERGYAQLSELAVSYIGGILRHAPALLAFCAPTTNSYRRLVPGYEAPINLVYSNRNRSACCRIPAYSKSPKAKRVEFRAPDPSCNPYLAFSAILMAGLDGIQNKIQPPAPVDKDIYEMDRVEFNEPGHQADAGHPGRLARRPRGGPRGPAPGRRVHPRPDRDLHRLQARARGGADRAAPAPLRVRPLLRRVSPLPLATTLGQAPKGRRHPARGPCRAFYPCRASGRVYRCAQPTSTAWSGSLIHRITGLISG